MFNVEIVEETRFNYICTPASETSCSSVYSTEKCSHIIYGKEETSCKVFKSLLTRDGFELFRCERCIQEGNKK